VKAAPQREKTNSYDQSGSLRTDLAGVRLVFLASPTTVRLRSGRSAHRRSERDALIAAIVMVHGLTVVTRNVVDFEAIGVILLNLWKSHGARRPK
jgi:predicted nucleic acid-binding protein